MWDAQSPASLGLSCLKPKKRGERDISAFGSERQGCRGGGGCDSRQVPEEIGAGGGNKAWLPQLAGGTRSSLRAHPLKAGLGQA